MIQREAAAVADAFDDTAERLVDILAAIEKGDDRDAILGATIAALGRLNRASMPYRTAAIIGELDRPLDVSRPNGPCVFERVVATWESQPRTITL